MARKPPLARKKEAFTPGHPTDIKIGICRGVGLSREDTAQVVGCSVPTVDLRKLEPACVEWESFTRKVAESFTLATKEHFEKAVQRRVGKALDVIDRAIEDDDLNLALKGVDRVLDRAYGKATQKVESTSEVTERHVLEIPEETLARLRELAGAPEPRQLEGVIDAEVVEDDGGPSAD